MKIIRFLLLLAFLLPSLAYSAPPANPPVMPGHGWWNLTYAGIGPNLMVGANAIEDDTDATTGWPAASNGVVVSQQATVNGSTNAFQVDSNLAPTSDARIFQNLNLLGTFVDGEVYLLSVDVRHIGANGAWRFQTSPDTLSTTTTIATLTSTDTTWTTYTHEFTFSSTEDSIVFRESSGTNNGGLYIDNFSIRKK